MINFIFLLCMKVNNNQIYIMELSQDKFQLIKTGSNSKIYRYGDKDSGVILKTVPASCQKQSKHMLNQYKLLKKLNHQNVINVLKYKEGIKLNGLYNVLVMEQASKGNLLDFYKRNRLTLPEIKHIFSSICSGIEYLHQNYIAHRDIKLQNILVFQSQDKIIIKISDFGFASNVFDGQNIKTFNCFKGTKRGYMAPEIHQCLKNPNLAYEARKSDCFALGVVLFSLVLGKLPFQYGSKQNKLYNLISDKKFEQFWTYHMKELQKLQMQDYSMVEQFKSLFENMVAYRVQQRYCIEQVLQSVWLKNGMCEQLKGVNYK